MGSSYCSASVKTIEVLGTTAIGIALGAASGLLCKAVKENVLPTSVIRSFIACWLVWGATEDGSMARIANELIKQDVACSPTLMWCGLKIASYAAYFGYLDKYVAQCM